MSEIAMTSGCDAPRTHLPLLVRPGARFDCFGDGVCCTDVHLLGPLSPRDRRALSAVGLTEATQKEGGRLTLVRDAAGVCARRVPGGCGAHATFGMDVKPRICRGFPFAVVRTPLGRRVTTAHRCPCRTLGERSPIVESVVRSALADGRGRIADAWHVGPRVAYGSRTTVSFATWTKLEAGLIERLVRGDRVEEVLDEPARLPPILGITWRAIAADLVALGESHPARGFVAIAHVGDALGELAGARVPAGRPRPWRSGFDAAEARSPNPRGPSEVIGDYFADRLWDLSWTRQGSFALARSSFAVLSLAAHALAARFTAEGARSDRAEAEAVLCIEMTALHPIWADVARRLQIGPARPLPML